MVQLKQVRASGALQVIRVAANGITAEVSPDLIIASGGAPQTIGPGLGAVAPNTRSGVAPCDLQTSRSAAAAIAGGNRSFGAGADNQLTSGGSAVGERHISIDQFTFQSGLESYNSFRGSIVLSGGSHSGGRGAGTAQRTRLLLRGTTTNATPTVLNTPTVVLPRLNAAMAFTVWVVGIESVNKLVTAYRFEGLLKRVAGACSFVGTPSSFLPGRDSGASTWSAAIAASNANGIQVTVTGGASVSVNWAALFECTEVI